MPKKVLESVIITHMYPRRATPTDIYQIMFSTGKIHKLADLKIVRYIRKVGVNLSKTI